MVRRESGTGIAHYHPRLTIAIRSHGNHYVSLIGAPIVQRVQGIHDQIENHLFDLYLIRQYKTVGLQLTFAAYSPATDFIVDEIERLADDVLG